MKMIKKMIALALSAMLLCAAFTALAESLEPLYATIGDALAKAGENPIAGGEDDYYAVVTEEDGKYYRSVAETDDKYSELQQATSDAEPEQMEAAFAAVDEYVKTLPISYSEEFTAVPMSQADMDALVGKTLGDLREAGYEERESGTEGDGIAYVMRNGLFEYSFVVDADIDAYEKAQEEWPDGGNDFVIKSVSFHGITSEAVFKRFHTDGTVEEEADPFEGYADLIADVQEMIGRVQNGEDVDADSFFNDLKEKYPDLADSVEMYKGFFQMLGADGIASLLTAADETQAVIAPQFDRLDTTEGTYSAAFDRNDLKDGVLNNVRIFTEDVYDIVDVAQMAVGDTFETEGKAVTISSLETDEYGDILINGGFEEEGGYTLTTHEDTNGWTTTSWDDFCTYTQRDTVNLELAENVAFNDSWDIEKEPVTANGIEAVSNAIMASENRDFYEHNTELVIEGGKVVEINRQYVP